MFQNDEHYDNLFFIFPFLNLFFILLAWHTLWTGISEIDMTSTMWVKKHVIIICNNVIII